MRVLPAVMGLVIVPLLSAVAAAQSTARISNVEFGSHVSELPSDQWVEPACGTNGGPPSIRLESFAEFASCPVETETGLYEVWFIYDDEWEYIARAYGEPMEIRTYSANMFYNQPIITSLLIDEDGLVQGYRMVTDPRAQTDIRRLAYQLHATWQGLYNRTGWQCTDLPPGEREEPVEGEFLKSDCVMVSDERLMKVEGRLLRRPGQATYDRPGVAYSEEGAFESSARLDVYNIDAVRDAPCCSEAIAAAE